jgi:hypothetical protein
MMEIGLVLIDLPKPSYLVRESSVSEAISALAFRIFFKGKLRGSKQTATCGSPTAAKPRVLELRKPVDTNLSPTLAGLEAT